MSLDTQPVPLDACGGIDPYAEFRIDQAHEIAAFMRQLADGGIAVSLSSPAAIGVTTELWTVDGARQRIGFSVDTDSPELQRLIETEEATCVAYLDSVKLQFHVHHLLLVHGPRSCALQADMPSELYRFQRRRGFRVRTFKRGAPAAHLQHPLIAQTQLQLRILDVSIGGCALLLPHTATSLVAGVEIRGARIELDADLRFDTDLLLRHVRPCQTPVRGAQLGCEFKRLAPLTERALQRYIDRAQKFRGLLSLG